jgi:hypothetical protein
VACFCCIHAPDVTPTPGKDVVCVRNVPVPSTIQKARKIVNTIAISSAEAERSFSLMNIICKRVRNSLRVNHIPDLMLIHLLGKELAYWDATPFVKSWTNCCNFILPPEVQSPFWDQDI